MQPHNFPNAKEVRAGFERVWVEVFHNAPPVQSGHRYSSDVTNRAWHAFTAGFGAGFSPKPDMTPEENVADAFKRYMMKHRQQDVTIVSGTYDKPSARYFFRIFDEGTKVGVEQRAARTAC